MQTIAPHQAPHWDRHGLDYLALLDQWHVVARGRDIGHGVTVQVRLLGQDLMVWRSARGELQAWAGRKSHHNGALLAVPVELPPGLPQRHQRDGQAFAVREAYGLVWVCLGFVPAELPHPPNWDAPGYQHVLTTPASFRANALRCMDHFLHESPAEASAHGRAAFDALCSSSLAYTVHSSEGGLFTTPLAIALHKEEALEMGQALVLARYHCLSPTVACIEKGVGEAQPWFVWCAWTPVALDRASLWLMLCLPARVEAPDRLAREQHELVLPEDERWLVESLRPFNLPLGAADEAEAIGSPLSLAYRRWLHDLGLRRLARERPFVGLDVLPA